MLGPLLPIISLSLYVSGVALALAGRGVSRHSGFLIIYAYAVFAITVVVTAIRSAA